VGLLFFKDFWGFMPLFTVVGFFDRTELPRRTESSTDKILEETEYE